MAKTGAKFRRCNVEQAEAHNRRRKAYTEALKKKYGQTHYREELAHLNLYWDNSEYKGMSLAKIERQAAEEAKAKTGRKMQEKASPIREACPPIKPDTKIEDFDNFNRWLAIKGIKVISIDLHHDEGHYDKDANEWVPNHHAHIIVDWFDHDIGKAVRLTPTDCREMQTVLAESLGMERGTPKEDTGIEGLSATEYKLRKAKEELKCVKENIKNAKQELDGTNEKVKDKKSELEKVQAEVASMSTKKAIKQKVLGVFNQSAKDDEIRELKGEIAKVNAAKADDGTKFRQQLEEDARRRRELENRIQQLEKDKNDAVKKEQKSIFNAIILPLMKDVWNTLNGISSDHQPEPKDLETFYRSLQKRLKSTVGVTLPAIRKESELKGMQHYEKNTAEPRYGQYEKTISQQNQTIAAGGRTMAELKKRNKAMEGLLDAIGLSHPIIKDAYDAIYALSTTSAARRFTSVQASIVDKAISLAKGNSQRNAIAQWLLDQVWKAVSKNSTYSAWFQKNAYPETMTIANGEEKKESRNRSIRRKP